ncbi:hypothetical protein KQ302_00365 [Synechococcus sp. CS-602]|uniref:DUF6679 family protein n=1 Tax=unclassified Synechococcus TaxID=2626047 RepID=UPI0021A59A96|nr:MULTISPECIES: DUF6679 family protein [unclassified Synechococcus]MCT0203491.1 hypothetical protein [Synechococcus sp. CS-603]MCT0203577.1 hypothetical protein [Synechococcus sp. CS-602]
MLVRKLDQFRKEKRPIWMFLRDQQLWIEQALVVEIEGDLVTFRYDAEEDDESHSLEESVRLRSIVAVSTRLAFFNRSTQADELATAGDCPESEQLLH